MQTNYFILSAQQRVLSSLDHALEKQHTPRRIAAAHGRFSVAHLREYMHHAWMSHKVSRTQASYQLEVTRKAMYEIAESEKKVCMRARACALLFVLRGRGVLDELCLQLGGERESACMGVLIGSGRGASGGRALANSCDFDFRAGFLVFNSCVGPSLNNTPSNM